MPDTRKIVLLAAATAVVIAALCFLGNTPVAGLRLATIVTARFSGLIFAFALVARASRFASRRATLMLSFVAAHGGHPGEDAAAHRGREFLPQLGSQDHALGGVRPRLLIAAGQRLRA